MKIYILLPALFLSFSALRGQVFIEVGPMPNAREAFSSVIIYGSDGLAKTIPYDQVKGSPFWQGSWRKAYFFDRRDTALGSYRAKFNFVSQEVHYITKNGEEQVVIPDELNRVVFMREDDSTKIAAIFRYNIEEVRKRTACKNCFVQELNQGHTKLLKITQRQLKTADSLFGTLKTYFFFDAEEYFVQTGDQYNRIKRLNKTSFFSFIPGASLYNAWIREKGLRFNKESEYLVFLEHYNATYKKD